MAKIKVFCKWSAKDIARNVDLIRRLTKNPKYFCSKCGRVSNTKKSLCKPAALLSKKISL